MSKNLKIALVHDDLVQWGGAEKLLLSLSEVFPRAPIYTSVMDFTNPLIKKYFNSKIIITSFMQKIPGWRSLYRAFLPLYPLAFEQFDFSAFDIVLSQTTRFAKSIITRPETKHICYCHTPPRFLWNFSDEKTPFLLQPYLKFLKQYDRISSGRVDYWIAGSKNAQERIKQIYNAESMIIYPFVDMDKFGYFGGYEGDYLLVISRLNKYKRADLAILASEKLNIPVKVVGKGPELERLATLGKQKVELLGTVDDEMLAHLLLGCKAVLVTGEEDFGIVSLEAQALGKPVIAFGKGGALETVIDGCTGYFFYEQTVESLCDALEKLYKKGYNQKRCKENAKRFSKERFYNEFQNLILNL
ncbi:hypothetical protein A2617_04125 [Candidatus Daviesbacteria bacterium RIFOXYD1_FULL_41_10]|uniref:GDP-Man:Man(1)GlcNAc(2)-PP-Dol alpha-1,3-mannosyltransferase n=2 Tax=Candidatus Daviesiibacteriota TaxID=1752718 RepID=A0A1F5N0L5_9BACT|nr:MAG: Glycosyl transferase group 1 [Candidatus Daviesbacteria bacterium GW2011_GWB1_41_5]OGE71151.1 MAG: hypothetical protein A2617_04125 [Candidatus Daviesbacteria bacterium RIFOXYD1_FULL_41_10]